MPPLERVGYSIRVALEMPNLRVIEATSYSQFLWWTDGQTNSVEDVGVGLLVDYCLHDQQQYMNIVV